MKAALTFLAILTLAPHTAFAYGREEACHSSALTKICSVIDAGAMYGSVRYSVALKLVNAQGNYAGDTVMLAKDISQEQAFQLLNSRSCQ